MSSATGLPDGWEEVRLRSLGTFFRGKGGTKADEQANGLPCIRYGDLYTQHDCIVRSFSSFITPASAWQYTRLQQGDCVIAGSGETFEEIGKAAAYCEAEEAYAGGDTIIFRPGEDLDAHFAGYALNSVPANQHKSRMGQGSSVIHISAEHLGSMELALPPLPQQQRIAEILSTMDEAIEQTEALIAKTQQIKAGLMHDLFTRGVTPEGQLRPPREEAPQLYKESSLGWIPQEWDVAKLRECLVENPTNGIYKPAELIGRGTLLVGQTSFTPQRSIDYGLSRRAIVDEYEQRRYGLAKDDILVTRVFATVEGVGRPVLVPALPEAAVYESNMMRMRVKQDLIRPQLLFELLRSDRSRKLLVKGINASNQCSVNQSVLNPLPVLRPPIGEQGELLRVIQAEDERHASERSALRKLKQVKSGLVRDLLIGRVEVTPAAVANV